MVVAILSIVCAKKSDPSLSTIFTQNMEALADGEHPNITLEFCFKAGSLGGDKYQCSEDTPVYWGPATLPTGEIAYCSGSINPSFLTRTGYCYITAN